VGEKQNRSFQLCFNDILKVDFQGSRAISDGGLILVRELDEHLGMNQLIEQHLTNSRRGNSAADLGAAAASGVKARLNRLAGSWRRRRRGGRGVWPTSGKQAVPGFQVLGNRGMAVIEAYQTLWD
jgi:hypothetical protein